MCPSRIKVDKVKTVVSDECLSCLECVSACPVKDTLQLTCVPAKKPIPKWGAAIAVLLLFVVITGGARLAGKWHNSVPIIEYLFNYQHLDNLGHPRSAEDMRQLGN